MGLLCVTREDLNRRSTQLTTERSCNLKTSLKTHRVFRPEVLHGEEDQRSEAHRLTDRLGKLRRNKIRLVPDRGHALRSAAASPVRPLSSHARKPLCMLPSRVPDTASWCSPRATAYCANRTRFAGMGYRSEER